MRDAPAWLGDFQARFGEVLRTPLDRASGTLTATPERYDARTASEVRGGADVSGAERLAIYNRQRWFRLFDVLQSAFPLTCRLLGPWTFNAYAARYLVAHPPCGWDLDAMPDRFADFFAEDLAREAHGERLALVEAARIDAAFRAVFRAPSVVPYRPSPGDGDRLLDAHLERSPAVVLVEEHRPLLEVRRRLSGDPSEATVALPPALARPRATAIVRTHEATAEIPLEAREVELLVLLRELSVRDALERLERACSPEERDALPAKTGAWLMRSVQRDFWCGVRFDA